MDVCRLESGYGERDGGVGWDGSGGGGCETNVRVRWYVVCECRVDEYDNATQWLPWPHSAEVDGEEISLARLRRQ